MIRKEYFETKLLEYFIIAHNLMSERDERIFFDFIRLYPESSNLYQLSDVREAKQRIVRI